eukprot:1184010-Prorocentrum_minimum.AAC.4
MNIRARGLPATDERVAKSLLSSVEPGTTGWRPRGHVGGKPREHAGVQELLGYHGGKHTRSRSPR